MRRSSFCTCLIYRPIDGTFTWLLHSSSYSTTTMSDDDPFANSQFREWLGTNYSPTNNQVAQIKEFLVQPLSDLTALDEQVRAAQQALNALLAKQRKLKSQIDAHQALIHPIRRLPKELLQEIFLHCLPTAHLPVMASAEAPMLLTRVCRPWRDLALSTPTLWSSIHIPIPRGRTEREHAEVTQGRLRCVNWWLGLAKETRLAISLYWPSTLRYAHGTEHFFTDCVLSYSSRIRNLELDLPDHILRSFANVDPSQFPHLDRVALRLPVFPGDVPRGVGLASANIWKAPNLTKVSWVGVNEDFLRLPLRWSAMQEISVGGGAMVPLSYFSPGDALSLVEACPSLVKLSLELTLYPESRIPEGFGSNGAQQATPNESDPEGQTGPLLVTPVLLPYLTTLDLTDIFLDHETRPIFLENVRLPALKRLKYSLIGLAGTPTAHSHPLLSFLRAQEHPIGITHFRITSTSVSREIFLEALHLLPLVKEVYVEDQRPLWDRQGITGNWKEDAEYEVAPDDELLRAFLPPCVWKQDAFWDGRPVDDFCVDVVGFTALGRNLAKPSQGGEGPSLMEDVTMGEAEVSTIGAVSMPPLDVTDVLDETIIEPSSTTSPPSASPPSDLPPSSPIPPPAPRISVAIPVDTSDLAAEEAETLCPRLQCLRFDRARFTLRGVKAFIETRLALSKLNSESEDAETVPSHESSPTRSAFVSALSSPVIPTANTSFYGSMLTTLHLQLSSEARARLELNPPVAELERFYAGLTATRRLLEADDDDELFNPDYIQKDGPPFDLESYLRSLGVGATIKYAESETRHNVSSERLRNGAREGVYSGGGGAQDGGWGWDDL